MIVKVYEEKCYLEFYLDHRLIVSLMYRVNQEDFRVESLVVIEKSRMYLVLEELLILIDQRLRHIKRIIISYHFKEYRKELVQLGFILERDFIFERRSVN